MTLKIIFLIDSIIQAIRKQLISNKKLTLRFWFLLTQIQDYQNIKVAEEKPKNKFKLFSEKFMLKVKSTFTLNKRIKYFAMVKRNSIPFPLTQTNYKILETKLIKVHLPFV